MTLQNLLVDEKQLDESLLEKVLTPFVRIGKDTGKFRFTPLASKMSIKHKILLFLLAKKAAKVLSIKGAEESASPQEIETELGIRGNSLRPNLKFLYDSNVISGGKGKYFVPNYLVNQIYEDFFRIVNRGETNE